MPPCGAIKVHLKNILMAPAAPEPMIHAGITCKGSAAAYGIADILTDHELNRECILPDPFDRRVAEQVAKAVAETAMKTGLARCK